MDPCSSDAIPPSRVYSKELELIVQRRNKALGPHVAKSTAAVEKSLVGLANSGGGLRSATFNLGLIQALRRYGLLPFIDYQSSISGGGYTAGYLARAAHDEPKFHQPTEQTADLPGAVDGAISPVDHLRFRDCGSYLRRPVEFLAEYLFCTSIVLALFISGLLALALTTAIFWRTLDFPIVGENLAVINLNVELLIAFIPCGLLLVVWVMLAVTHKFYSVVDRWLAAINTAKPRAIRRFLIVLAVWAAFVATLWAIRQPWMYFNCIPFLAFGVMLLISIGLAGVASSFSGRMWKSQRGFQDRLRPNLGPLILFVLVGISAFSLLAKYIPWAPIGGLAAIKFDRLTGNYEVNEQAFVTTVFGLVAAFFLLAWAALGTKQAAHKVFLGLLISPVVALMVLVANGSLNLGWLSEFSGIDGDLKSQRLLREPLLAFVALCVVVLFRYRRLLQSARPDAKFWERVVFGVVVSGIVLGVPMILIGWAGREGISGYADYRDPDLVETDILNWPEYLDLWRDNKELGPDRSIDSGFQFDVESFARSENRLFDVPSWRRNRYTVFQPEFGFVARAGMLLQSWISDDPAVNPVPGYLARRRRMRADIHRFCGAANTNEWLGSADLTAALAEQIRLRSLASATPSDHELSACANWVKTHSVTMNVAERERLVDYFERATDHLKHQAPTSSAPESKPNAAAPATGETVITGPMPGVDLSLHVDGPYWDGAAKPTSNKRAFNRRSFNRLLLELLYPKIFKQRAMVSTPVVVAQDQITRVGYLALAGGVFLVLFFTAPVNRLSPIHNFYCRMLDTKFLAPIAKAPGEKLMLAELNSHGNGAPYPLFMASLYFVDDQPTDVQEPIAARRRHRFRETAQIDPSSSVAQLVNDDPVPSHLLRGRCVPLTMSPEFCGTREFGFQKTTSGNWINLSVADAVSISGAALSPLAFSTGPVYWILSAFNLRTGRWVSHPQKKPEKSQWLRYIRPCQIYREFFGRKPSALPEADSFFTPESNSVQAEQELDASWQFGSAADGGFCDYLGIEPLLDRRCRLIIASDAGCNQGSDEFRSLGDLMRKVRLEQGIEILDWDDDRPLEISRLQRDEKTRLSPQHFVLGRIIYPSQAKGANQNNGHDGAPPQSSRATEGVLVYIQMTLDGDEGADLAQYHRAHATFPDEPTPNQFFDPTQVEVYRSLGYHTGKTLCFELGERLLRRNRKAARKCDVEFLIQRLSDMYALAGSAENRVAADDFHSRQPFFPELKSTLRYARCGSLRHRLPLLADEEFISNETNRLRRFERSAEYRRKIMLEVEREVRERDRNGSSTRDS